MSTIHNWALISVELLAAYTLLPSSIIESDFGYCEEDFLEYLSVNELRLAMEELDGVMVNNISPGVKFWKHMLKAASLMKCTEHYKKYERYKVTT
ncbi:hypothetical protein I6F65_19990 [Pseudoalteromonas sp. SWXJZ94C]|uniref:hypothetical protein n=1 Tax=unclassified Pseudoalteromonas TaxID=194690 RepID=UPI000467E30D|nr:MULTISPECIES: hypothetical protein [unclassified Pseudoalteromonas]MBH0059226.1 hypothetical protein [Pseudoalteromonas sp. SWXJZ94C]